MPTLTAKLNEQLTVKPLTFDKYREQWLTEVAKQVEPIFKHFRLPPYRVTCGWPSSGGLGLVKRTIGQCFGVETSTGGFAEIFISPVLEKPLEVVGTLTHEMVHVVAGTKAKHGGEFIKISRHIGLTNGKPIHALPGKLLNDQLVKIIEPMGIYPHKAIKPTFHVKKPPTSTSLECSECGCKITMSFKWIEEAGLPTCACGMTFNTKE
jgi:hypothetical protein